MEILDYTHICPTVFSPIAKSETFWLYKPQKVDTDKERQGAKMIVILNTKLENP